MLLIITYLYLCNISQSQNGWILKNFAYDFNTVCFLDQNTGWVGSGVHLFKTSDGGSTFQLEFINEGIREIKFVNSNTGFIGGYNLYKTTNKGLNWLLINTGISNMSYDDICFINDNTGWIASLNFSKMIKTTDGGINWSLYYIDTASINSIFFVNETTGWCARYKYQYKKPLIKTTNGGLNWFYQDVDTNVLGIQKLFFVNVNTGFCSYQDNIYKTSNSGINWSLINNNLYATRLKFQDQNTGWATCLSNSVKKTTNGGLNFMIVDTSISFFSDVYFTTPNLIWTTGGHGILKKSTNGGQTWTSFNSNFGFYSKSLSISKINNTVWFDDFKSTDYGNTWMQFYNQVIGEIQCTNFINDSTGFLARTSRAIYYSWQDIMKTTNNGTNWITVLSTPFILSVTPVFKSFYFVNDFTGWAVGTDGMMYKTSNSGNNWLVQNTGTTFSLQAIKFINQFTGFCTATNGNLLKTTDSGLNWSLYPTGASAKLYGIFFTNINTGWITGENGQILKTTNSGLNWFSQNTNTNKNIYNIYFMDNDFGWACGDSGLILKTLNSGNLWRIDMINIGSEFNNIVFFNHNTGLCYGKGGTILKTTTGGATWYQNNSDFLPSSFSLSQNYPNPFNPTTSIKYQIKELSSPHVLGGDLVQIKVYDILGKEIETLVNEKQSPGTYEVTWDASAFPSGVYFYRLEAGDFKQTNKMILIK